ncbi:hypothetical protein CMO86_09255 [Candidatus Woesearchaeota archaeon]|nr:hypothetical protein [Candidatus Woesearchaeota archaeon]
MKSNDLSIPFYLYKVNNWEEKKKKLISCLNQLKRKKIGNVITSQMLGNVEILSEEIEKFQNEIDVKLLASESWFQLYENGMNHSVHNHGAIGFSSICYVSFKKEIHKSTKFVLPFLNPIDGSVQHYSPNVDEGFIIFFPSNLMHYAPVNTSCENRIIFSFNLEVDYTQDCSQEYKYK